MNLRAALLAATMAGACLFVGACGGGGDDTSGNVGGSGSTGSTGNTGSAGSTGNAGSSGSTGSCPPQTQITVVGGDLFVADQGLIAATLLSNGGLALFDVQLGYSTCDSNCTSPQRQDSFAFAFSVRPPLFNANIPAGTTLTLQPQSGIPINDQMVSAFPTGTPIFLTFGDGEFNDFSATAHSKDLGHTYPETALVTYGANNTAVIDFGTSAGAHIRVGLTNVRGSSGGGC
jgi:hypothetical protein